MRNSTLLYLITVQRHREGPDANGATHTERVQNADRLEPSCTGSSSIHLQLLLLFGLKIVPVLMRMHCGMLCMNTCTCLSIVVYC